MLHFRDWFLAEAAIHEVPYLHGLDYDQAVDTLNQFGFHLVKTTPDGYQHFRHADRSEVKIRPDGRIKRIGPKIDSLDSRKPGRFQPKYFVTPSPENQLQFSLHPYYPPGTAQGLTHDSGEQINMLQFAT